MKRVVVLLLLGVLWPALPAVGAASEPAEGTSRIALPLAFDRVWFRSGGKKREGDLIVTEQALELTARKKAFSIPLDRIHAISLGTMSGDVDTEWIVMAVGVRPPYDLVGIRDGAKWGYGARTQEFYTKLRRVFEQLAVAQYDVPAGHKPYEDPDRSCTIAIPEDWNSYLESLVLVGGRAARGTTMLTEARIRRIERSADGQARAVDDLELLDAILAGESPGFFIERADAERGMNCDRLSGGARERLLERARGDLVFGEGFDVLEAPRASDSRVGGCAALQVVGRSRRPDGAEVVLELFAAAKHGTLYLFGVRALADRYERFREPFVVAVESATFAVAAPD